MNFPMTFEMIKHTLATRDQLRDFIAHVEREAAKGTPVSVEHTPYHSGNVYAREINPVAGTLIVGKIHRKGTLNFLLKGVVDVISQDGIARFTAPCTFVSTPGAKRVIYVVEDATWTCCHGTEETDELKIEEEFIAKDYSEVCELPAREVLQLEGE